MVDVDLWLIEYLYVRNVIAIHAHNIQFLHTNIQFLVSCACVWSTRLLSSLSATAGPSLYLYAIELSSNQLKIVNEFCPY